MAWTDLILEPRALTTIYGNAPSLDQFELEELSLACRNVNLKGNFKDLPSPLPQRWSERGYTHAGAMFSISDVIESKIIGTPRIHFDDRKCLQGDPVDLAVDLAGSCWIAPGGAECPYIAVSGKSDYLTFRFVCHHLWVEVKGYRPAPY